MRSFTKLILGAVLVAVSSGMASALANPTLNVHIQKLSGGSYVGVGSVTVAAIEFGMNGPSTHTQTGVTDANGDAFFNLEAFRGYSIFYTSHGYSPSITDQFNNPEYDPNRSLYAHNNTAHYSTFTITQNQANVGKIVQEFINATPGKVLFGGLQNVRSQMQSASGIVVSSQNGAGMLVIDNVPYAEANTYNVGLYDSELNRGIGRNVMLSLGNGTADFPGSGTISYIGNEKLNFIESVPPSRVENNNQQPGDSAAGVSVEGLIHELGYSTATVGHMGIGIKACVLNNEWNAWANSDENGRFQLYGLTPGVTYYLSVMGGCTWGGPGQDSKCYAPYSSPQYNLPSICSVSGDVNSNDIYYSTGALTADVVYHRVQLPKMPRSTGQIKVYVRSSSGYGIPNANVNVSPDGSPWARTDTGCASNDFSGYSFNPGFSNANVNTSATGYALLDGLPSGNYNVNVWTPFSSGGGSSAFNGNGDNFTAFEMGDVSGGNWQQAHCYGTGVNDYRVTIDTNNVDQTMYVYDSSGAYVQAYTSTGTTLHMSSITYIVSAQGSESGLVRGTLKFPGLSDLLGSPIMITLYPQCDGMGGCGTGNFTVLASSGASQYPYEIRVASGAVYYMNVNAVGWGRINRGGGNNSVNLASTGTAVIDMEFAPAGTITGTLYKPDGSIFTPTAYQYVNINVSNNYGWTSAQLQKDGTFAMHDVLPGVNRLSVYNGGGTFNYTLPSPAPTATVVANSTATVNIHLVKSNYVGAGVVISSLPAREIIKSGYDTILGFKVIPLPAGTVLKGESIAKMLTGGDEEEMRINYSSPTTSMEDGRCGSSWPGGFCAIGFPSPSVYDFYLMRAGDFAKDGVGGSNQPYPHFTVISSSKNVIVDDAHATARVYPQGAGMMPLTISSGVLVNLTPSTNLADRGNTTLKGGVAALNFFRNTDYEATGGDFDKFTRYLPVVALYDANGAFAAAGVVLPPPDFIAANDMMFQEKFAQGYDAFNAFIKSPDATPFGYEIRALAPLTCYTAVLTTPNYPPYQSKVCTGERGSTTTVSIDLDDVVGSGATLTGVVTSTAAAKLANAEVQLSGEGIDARSAVTNSSGSYTFEGLPAGTVRIKVAMTGYALGEAETDLSGDSVVTQHFQLTAAGGSITGTVYSQKLPYAKVQAGAEIMAYNDQYNYDHPTLPLPLLKTRTGADGTYTLTGLVAGDMYKVFLKVPGKYTLNQSTMATSGNVSGIDFTMLAKPLDIEIFSRKGESSYEFTMMNPQDFKTGVATWSRSPYGTGTISTMTLTKLSSGELSGSIPLFPATDSYTYVLQCAAVSYSGKTVVKEILFGNDYKGNTDQHIDDAIIGDDSDDGFGRKLNEAPIDKSGGDASSLSFKPGAMLAISSAAIPSVTLSKKPAGSAAASSLATDAFAGDLYTVALSSVSIVEAKGFEITLAYDKSTSDLTDLAVAEFNDTTSVWTTVPAVATINPVKGTVKVKLKKLASVLSSKHGASTQQFSTFNGREYVVRPQTSGSSASSSYGTYAVIRPSVAGTAISGNKLKVFNYPNPFNLKDKAIANSGGASLPGSTYGTVIHVEVPAGNGGPGHVRIYTLAGELVRDISVDFTDGVYNYVVWNGKNKGGQEVANGVYYGVVEMSGKSPSRKDATFKMAVIK